jgi:methyltransferase-like protein 6
LFRDYCVSDAAQTRFRADRKLGESLYVRQDGTLSYFFSKEELEQLFMGEGFKVEICDLVHSKTTNVKKEIDVDRVFIQAKFRL